jgi:archaellum component FlaC
MPDEKPHPKVPPAEAGPAWQVIIEDMRSQNRIAMEAAETFYSRLDRKIEERGEKTDAQIQGLTLAVRQNSADIHALGSAVRQNSTDIQALQGDVQGLKADVEELKGDVRTLKGDVRDLTDKVDDLSSVKARVASLERQRG